MVVDGASVAVSGNVNTVPTITANYYLGCTNSVIELTGQTPPATLNAGIENYTYVGSYGGHYYYQSNNNNDYSFTTSNISFFEGQGATVYMATINDAAENAVIRQIAANQGTDLIIGYNDVIAESNFVWQGGNGSGYTNWNGGEPNNVGNEDYVEIRSVDGLWNDISNVEPTLLEFEVLPSWDNLADWSNFGTTGNVVNDITEVLSSFGISDDNVDIYYSTTGDKDVVVGSNTFSCFVNIITDRTIPVIEPIPSPICDNQITLGSTSNNPNSDVAFLWTIQEMAVTSLNNPAPIYTLSLIHI